MRTRGLVILDAFNTLVVSGPGFEQTFLAGLAAVSEHASSDLLTTLQRASEGLDHSEWSSSRRVYSEWAAGTLASLTQAGARLDADLAPRVVPALEQLHQAPTAALPDAAECLAMLKDAGFSIAVCSNWGWDLAADMAGTGLMTWIDVLVTSARIGYRKPHPRIYQATLDQAGFNAADAVFVGDSLRTDALGPQQAGIRSVLLARDTEEQIHSEQVASLGDATRLLLD